MKRVGLLISQMNKGGAERVVSRLSHILSNKYDVYVILFENTYMEYNCGGTIINLDIKSSQGIINKLIILLKRIKSLKKVKEKYGLNIVISFLDGPNIVNILSKCKHCRVGISIRNYTIHENSSSFLTKLVNYCIKVLYNKADVVIPVTNTIADSYIKDYRIKRDKIHVIYNPYDIEEIQQLANEELESQFRGFFSKECTFISVGRQMYQKGFWHLIKAFKLVHDIYNNTKLIIVGKDYNNGKTQKLIDDLGLNNYVNLLGQQENPFKFIKNSDVYILSSLFEGFPNAMVEAMACGCPVIAADCKSGPREILCQNPDINVVCTDVEKKEFGILTPPMEFCENWDITTYTESEKKLAEAMIMMIKHKKLRLMYGHKALERAKFFSYERCRQHLSKIIDE